MTYTIEQAAKNLLSTGQRKVTQARKAYEHAQRFWFGHEVILWAAKSNGVSPDELVTALEAVDSDEARALVQRWETYLEAIEAGKEPLPEMEER